MGSLFQLEKVQNLASLHNCHDSFFFQVCGMPQGPTRSLRPIMSLSLVLLLMDNRKQSRQMKNTNNSFTSRRHCETQIPPWKNQMLGIRNLIVQLHRTLFSCVAVGKFLLSVLTTTRVTPQTNSKCAMVVGMCSRVCPVYEVIRLECSDFHDVEKHNTGRESQFGPVPYDVSCSWRLYRRVLKETS